MKYYFYHLPSMHHDVKVIWNGIYGKIMNENLKQKYSDVKRIFFGIFGTVFLLMFFAELYIFIFERNTKMLFMALPAGFVGYVFSHAAYKGKAPSWFDDKSIFKSNDSNNISNVDNQ